MTQQHQGASGTASTGTSVTGSAGGSTGAGAARPFGWRDKVGYMCGDFGTDFMFLFASTWFMIFYTKVMGIPGAVVGTLFLLARVLDAVMDVTVGVVVDRSKDHPGGKFRVTMMRFTAPLVIMSFLMYQTFAIDAAMWVKVAYMAVTYVVWCFFYSCVNIPFGSLASTISAEADDRTSLSTMRSMGGTIGGLVLGIVAPIVIYEKVDGHQVIRGGEGSQVFAVFAAGVSIAAFIGYLICYFTITERVHPEPDQNAREGERRSPLRMIANAFSSRSMLGIVAAALCLLVAQLFSNQLLTYVYTDVFGSAALASVSGLLGTAVMFLVVPFVKPLTKRFGRKAICSFASALGAVAMILLFVMQTRNGIVFLVGTIFMYFALMGFNLVIWAMITDVIDDIEVTRDTREEATCFSCYSFARKIGQAVAGELAGLSLGWVGYQSGATAVQSAATKAALYDVATLVPGVFFLLTFVCLVAIYPLGRDRVLYNVEVLRVKRKGVTGEEARLLAKYEGWAPSGFIPADRPQEWPDFHELERARVLSARTGVPIRDPQGTAVSGHPREADPSEGADSAAGQA